MSGRASAKSLMFFSWLGKSMLQIVSFFVVVFVVGRYLCIKTNQMHIVTRLASGSIAFLPLCLGFCFFGGNLFVGRCFFGWGHSDLGHLLLRLLTCLFCFGWGARGWGLRILVTHSRGLFCIICCLLCRFCLLCIHLVSVSGFSFVPTTLTLSPSATTSSPRLLICLSLFPKHLVWVFGVFSFSCLLALLPDCCSKSLLGLNRQGDHF